MSSHTSTRRRRNRRRSASKLPLSFLYAPLPDMVKHRKYLSAASPPLSFPLHSRKTCMYVCTTTLPHFNFHIPPLLLPPSFVACRCRCKAFIRRTIRFRSAVCFILVAICSTWSASSRTGNLEARKRQKVDSLHFCLENERRDGEMK